jgi:phenylalanyl-tRNA synthetase beta chain
MKFTLSWLKQFLETQANLLEITQALTNIGFEVEDVIDKQEELKDFEVAEIIETIPHPGADKLKICKVQTRDAILEIVCGAPNARAGIKVVRAKVGALIPNGNFTIKESIIRGIKSFGMLCSEAELLIGHNHDGIIELDDSAIIGEQILKYYGLDDPVIHINVTPNRPDALSVYGVARDLAAKGVGTLKELKVLKVTDSFASNMPISVKDQAACPLFALREIRGLKNKQSPDWLKQLLENIGIGSISPIVDITNYICYSFGTPMHAYDADKVSGSIVVERLTSHIKFTALNGKEYDLQHGDLVIRDTDDIHCLAGIIGSVKSACSETTERIILEAACFDAVTISKTGRRQQIETDARYRFERKVDQSFVLKALDIASSMIISICGGEGSEIISYGNEVVAEKSLNFELSFIEQYSGINIEPRSICNILENLGFVVQIQAGNLSIKIPSWRPDVSIKEDIIEEILRIYGYDNLPEIPLAQFSTDGPLILKSQKRVFDSKRVLASLGYDEVVSWSFMDINNAKLFTEVIQDELLVINPISSDLNYMRPTIIPNLLKIVAKNYARSIRDISLFEVGPIFNGTKPEEELLSCVGIRIGNAHLKDAHHANVRLYDIFDVKADLEVLLSHMGLDIEKCKTEPTSSQYYHPTRSANFILGKSIIATFGQIHPKVLKHFDIDQALVAFEINFANVPLSKPKFGKKEELVVSDFQIVSRDYAFIIHEDLPVGEIISTIRNVDKKLIQSVHLFDIYHGGQLEPGTKSIAISVKIQADDKTLSEADLSALSGSIISIIEQKFAGKLR